LFFDLVLNLFVASSWRARCVSMQVSSHKFVGAAGNQGRNFMSLIFN